MIIKEIDLDDLCTDEYIALLETLINYYYVQFDRKLELKELENDL